ncbi:MAG: toxic anion resistance protein [Desulfovibrio sp.]|uniref:toxic anion resistance protein n=1 Tax=Desulfovibrio sp. TaxID=885 RepID=UPI00135DECA0|nr:toxic anion resistance protein [Desulfovibrio sp.]MTJ94018.1 toxic anion resistance protein [Desulfovibrio sp.]
MPSSPAIITTSESADIALSADDEAYVLALRQSLDRKDPISITNFGQDVGAHVAQHTDALLARVSGSDLNIIGDKLGKVLSKAQGINTSRRFSGIPVVGKMIGKVVHFKERLLTTVKSASEQIGDMMMEVDSVRGRLVAEVGELETMYSNVKDEYRLLGLHIVAAKQQCEEYRGEAATLAAKVEASNDPELAQELADLQQDINRLDKRSTDLAALQESALQTLPAIRIMQRNCHSLVEKYQTIQTVTVPAWRRQIALAITLEEQREAVELAEDIDNTTNALLRRNADLLHDNAVRSAKANQRLVIDVETLQHVQDQIIKTCTEVIQIEKAGAKERRDTEAKLQNMRTALTVKLLSGSDKAA